MLELLLQLKRVRLLGELKYMGWAMKMSYSSYKKWEVPIS